MDVTPKKLSNSKKNCFICSTSVLQSKQRVCALKSGKKGLSNVDLQGLINKTLEVDVAAFAKCDISICIKCYKSLQKFEKAERHVLEVKNELKTTYLSNGARRVKRLIRDEDETLTSQSAKKQLSFSNQPSSFTSSNSQASSVPLPNLVISPIITPNQAIPLPRFDMSPIRPISNSFTFIRRAFACVTSSPLATPQLNSI